MISRFFKKTLPLFSKQTLTALLLAAAIGLTGCTNTATTTAVTTDTATTSVSATTATGETLEAITADEEDADATYNTATSTLVQLNGNSIAVTGSGATAKGSVLTISKEGTYIISGTLKAGQIIVETDKEAKVHIVLNGVNLTSSSGPAIYIKSTEKAIITLAKDTQNTISDSDAYTFEEGEDEPDSAIFSKEDLSINGTGSLTVKGNYANGIKSKDTLLVMNGNLKVNAVTHAISGKDAVGVFGGTLSLTSGEDGIHSSSQVLVNSGNVNIAAEDDGIHADSALIIDGGDIKITKSYEGLESGNITVNNGSIALTASDDGFNAAGGNDGSGLEGGTVEQNFSSDANYFIKINNGTIVVNAQGDGLDANGSIAIAGGTVLVSGPTSGGNGALDYDSTCEVTGGTLAIAGSSGMAQAPSTTSTQNSVLVYYTEVQKANTLASLVDSTGKSILSFAPSKDYQTILISSPDLAKDKTYTLIAGGTSSVALKNNYATGGTVKGGTTLTKITIANTVTKISDKGEAVTSGDNPMGGGQGGPGKGGKGERPTGTPPSGNPPTGTPPADSPATGTTNTTSTSGN